MEKAKHNIAPDDLQTVSVVQGFFMCLCILDAHNDSHVCDLQIHKYTRAHTHTRTHTHTHTHTRARAHTHTRVHTCTHTRTHARTHKHARTHYIYIYCCSSAAAVHIHDQKIAEQHKSMESFVL
jgi:hypothetical protein